MLGNLIPPLQLGAIESHVARAEQELTQLIEHARHVNHRQVADELISVRGHLRISRSLLVPARLKNRWIQQQEAR